MLLLHANSKRFSLLLHVCPLLTESLLATIIFFLVLFGERGLIPEMLLLLLSHLLGQASDLTSEIFIFLNERLSMVLVVARVLL